MLCSGYGFFSRAMGLLFVLTLTGYTILVCNNTLRNQEREKEKDINRKEADGGMGLPLMLGLILLGLVLLATGSNLFIRGAVDLARYFGVSELIIGLTLAAIGTSLPELASSLAALRHNESGLLIGNVIGSNMFNLFMVLGLTGLLKPFTLSSDLLHRDLPVMLAFTLILIPILHKSGGTRRIHGVFLLGGYLLYCLSLV